MSSELKDTLRKRLDENYTVFMESLQGKTVSELINMAPEITAAKQCYEGLLDACDVDDVEFLLQFDNPLEVVRGYWESEITGFDYSSEMAHMLWDIRDRELYSKEQLAQPPKDTGEPPSPVVQGEKSDEKRDVFMNATPLPQITTGDLRKMSGQEGLILQGCGGDLQEWVDGINSLLTEDRILLNGSRFENVSTFQHGEVTNLLFPFEGVKLDMGRLAMWRIQTHDRFGGTWLSDYVPNQLGGFVQEPPWQKPTMSLCGMDGNIFAIMGRASALLKEAEMGDMVDHMVQRVTTCGDYYKALDIISEYVETERSPTKSEPKKSTKKKGKSAYER